MPARDLSTIENELLARKAQEPALAGFTNPSQTSRWRKLLDTVAYFIWAHETRVHQVLDEVDAIALENKPGNELWYAARAKEYQDGHDFDEVALTYATVDEDARIVRFSAANTTAPGQVTMKVAKVANDLPAPLDAMELERFGNYMAALNFAGTELVYVSEAGDSATVNATIYFDGELRESDVQAAVIAAIEAYFNDLPFNAKYRRSRLYNAIYSTPGVVDMQLQNVLFSDYLGGSETDPRTRILAAGYVAPPTINLTMIRSEA